MGKEKIIYNQAILALSAEAQAAGIKGMSYEDFRARREAQEQQSVEKLESLQKELHELSQTKKV